MERQTEMIIHSNLLVYKWVCYESRNVMKAKVVKQYERICDVVVVYDVNETKASHYLDVACSAWSLP
jgi:hypothetical protein